MRFKSWPSLAVAAVALLAAGCTTPPAPSVARAPLKLTILHTNDHHGRFWPNADGEYGLAARKTLIDRVRAEVAAAGGHTLLLDGGDVNTGVPESDLQDAEPDFKGMDRLGYDAMAVGNHEFDKPPAVLAKQRQWVGFPLLSANIYRDGRRLFEPYRIFERGGYRIAVMGLTTDDTARMVLPDHIAGVTFRKPADEAAQLVPQLRRQADMVIAATHMGHYPDGQRGVNAPGDVAMARAVPGLDLIVGGHSQNPVCMLAENRRNPSHVPGQPCAPDRQNGAWIVQAHEWGKYVGRADFVIDGGRVELVRYQLMPVNLKLRGADGKKTLATEAIAEDAGLRAFLQPFQQAGQGRLSVTIGAADGVLDGDRARVRQQPTNLGTLIARAMMDRTGADLALINSGGVRDSLPAGPITYRDVLKVQPFANTVGVVTLTGAELLDYLGAAAKMTPGAGGFAQTAGVQLRIAAGRLLEARVAGQPIDAQRRYRLSINNFTAIGGDGYPKLNTHPNYVDSGFNDAEVLRAYIARHSPLKVADYAPGDAVQRR
ncbi:MAG: bifunctional UDP-sugar hydrolase/5'-nucleotidase [Burkholderiales bacterium RIFCSPHIGHO2_12_FULL_69_20]|nr:MAG: bifunctional UDP-sugar hydrolase/5'-nucleotidase [Burkholderiales bacterium RIFCSPHIGHO2_12_FULL_69_20]